MSSFVHLHNHTHYSLLDGACRITDLVKLAHKYKMPALAITDHGNMFGVISFYKEALKAGIKPIIGMEAYIAPKSRHEKSGGKSGGETAFHLILLARNLEGYKNLIQLNSIGYLEGFYYKPRIDKEVLESHSEGLVVLSSCIKGEIPYKIIRNDWEGAKTAVSFYKDLFGENFYLEIQDHGIPEEKTAIKGLLKLSKEMEISVVATNDTHYLKREHSKAHDILLCIQTNRDFEDPNRMRFSTDELFFRSPDEMRELFKENPQVLTTSLEIAEKCHVVLDFETLHMPQFTLPEDESIHSLDGYLEKKAREGILKLYPECTKEIEDRLEFEISVIEQMGYSGYFLIVMDFIDQARKQNIPVGPGRGSAAGSLVSYALGITDVDPLKYGLLFERFLNPERVSLPDIDIDFCYERRDQIIDYVKKKYGEKNVTQIITFGSMNARGVIRDVGRVLKIPYGEVDQIAKMVPAQPGMTLDVALKKSPDLREYSEKNPAGRELMENAKVLEGLARHASIHAAGVVIAPTDLSEFVPLYKSTQGDVITQYDLKSLESIGLLKMDFLGLRNLTVIDHTIKTLREKQIEIDIHRLPLNDPDTFKIFSEGETIGVFQFESSGMRDYLKKLHPECLEDLIAMNALYRPGPMEWINDFIDRKHGHTPVQYIHPLLEPILKETHGIIVYQEQVMQIANRLGGFSMAKADVLRRAMGKKSVDLMQEQRVAFVEGAQKNGISENQAETIFDLMNRFAGYGFNKSHATCYSVVAYQTAFLKAHYPKEFMAANLTSEMTNIDRIVILIDECRRLNIEIYPPDINTSSAFFQVGGEGIRFGLGAIKNVGLGAIESIVNAREKDGQFKTIFDFCKRLNLRLTNKKVSESLIQVGALDTLEGTRAQHLAILPKAVQLAQSYQEHRDKGQTTIFGEEGAFENYDPKLPEVAPWTQAEILRREKELIGFYLSGHPLLKFEDEVNAFSNPKIIHLSDIKGGQNVRVCGIIIDVLKRFDRKDKQMAFFNIEDFTGSVRVVVFSDMYDKYQELIEEEQIMVVCGSLDNREERSGMSVILSEMIPIDKAMTSLTRQFSLNIEVDKINDEILDSVAVLLNKNTGTIPLLINLKMQNHDEVLLRSKKYLVQPTPKLIQDLRVILGKDNVWIEG